MSFTLIEIIAAEHKWKKKLSFPVPGHFLK